MNLSMTDTKLLKATGDVGGDWIVDEELGDGPLVTGQTSSAAPARRAVSRPAAAAPPAASRTSAPQRSERLSSGEGLPI